MKNETYCGNQCLYRRWREQFFQFGLEKVRKSIRSNAKQLLAPNAVKLSVQAPAVVVTYPDIVSKSRRSCNNQGNNITNILDQYFGQLFLPIFHQYFGYLADFRGDLGDGEYTSPR